MPRPKCIDCESYKLERIIDEKSHMIHHVHVCTNPEFAHVVTGTPVPAEHARQFEVFCGLEGKGFKQRADEPINKSLIAIEK